MLVIEQFPLASEKGKRIFYKKSSLMKRKLDILVLSDLHLGTIGCHADEVRNYLKSVQPDMLVLNGDIIDMWQFNKNNFPQSHINVLRQILKMASKGTKVFYLSGNHDDPLRQFGEMAFGAIHFRETLFLKTDGKSALIFHGDVFDTTVSASMRTLAILGGKGYNFLIRLNRTINRIRHGLGYAPVSFSARIKKSVKQASKRINDFENKAVAYAMKNNCDWVICGHTHQAEIRKIEQKGQSITYMNSGDWVESLTALEYTKGNWSIFKYDPIDFYTPSKLLTVKPTPAWQKSKPLLQPNAGAAYTYR